MSSGAAVVNAALFLFCALSGFVAVYAQTSSCASNCLVFGQLNLANPTSSCENGAIQYANAVTCMAACSQQNATATAELQATKVAIDSFCSKEAVNCPSVTSAYLNQTQCFDPYGGLNTVVKNIIADYNRNSDDIGEDCTFLFWGTYCQKYESTCQFNMDLNNQLIANNSQIVLGLACCGSEAVSDLSPLLVDDASCTDSLYKSIEASCNVASQIAQATSAAAICQAMQTQATCITNMAGTCTTALQTYLLPRLDTYGVANKYLGCTIQLNGLLVQPPVQSGCSYSSVINQCFFASSATDALDFYYLLPLFNMDLPIGHFCQNFSAAAAAVEACSTAMMSCPIPQSKLYVPPSSLSDSYGIDMGVFPLNQWGMNSIYNWLNGVCPSVQWTVPIASYTAAAPATTTTTQKATRVTPPPTPTPSFPGPNTVNEELNSSTPNSDLAPN